MQLFITGVNSLELLPDEILIPGKITHRQLQTFYLNFTWRITWVFIYLVSLPLN